MSGILKRTEREWTLAEALRSQRGRADVSALSAPPREVVSERHAAQSAFTLLELLLAVAILAAVSTLTFMSFGTVTSAWKRGMALSDDLHHGDYVIEQLVMGLRSAYQPDTQADAKQEPAGYGFVLEDDGDDAYASDTISWVKLGSSLIGKDSPFAASPHRVKFWVEENERGDRSATILAWRLLGQPDDFDPEELEPVYLASHIVGFNCRCADEPESGTLEIGDELEWEDEWEDTNRVPPLIELTLHLEPLDEDRDPVEIKRIVTVPIVRQEGR